MAKDKGVLEEKVNELIKEDINRKVLNYTMDENQKLMQELRITRQRLFTFRESNNLDFEKHSDDNKDAVWETTITSDSDDDQTKNDPPSTKDPNSSANKDPSTRKS